MFKITLRFKMFNDATVSLQIKPTSVWFILF